MSDRVGAKFDVDRGASVIVRMILAAAWIGVAITLAVFVFRFDVPSDRYHIVAPATAFPILVAIVVARVRHWWGTLFLAVASAILGAFTIFLWVVATAIHDRRAGLWIALVILGFGAVSIGSFAHIVNLRRAKREREIAQGLRPAPTPEKDTHRLRKT